MTWVLHLRMLPVWRAQCKVTALAPVRLALAAEWAGALLCSLR